ncbi:MAG: hypothetical protein NC833_07230 [Candidatus Omnitrophica bacterium]|nr:hypothetical protein [Candidatus Omnitrophota bacterium]
MSLKRLMGKDFSKILIYFLKFLCNCEKVKVDKFKKEGFKIISRCNSLCEVKILLSEDLNDVEIRENDKIVIFSNKNSLKNPLEQLKKNRIFIFNFSEFLKRKKYNLLFDFSNKKFLILTKFQMR